MACRFDVLFLGSGVSTAIPNLGHVVFCTEVNPSADDTSVSPMCQVCLDAISNPLSKNRRNNVSIAILFHEVISGKETSRVIVIDVGKTMRDTMINLFPRFHLSKIDSIMYVL